MNFIINFQCRVTQTVIYLFIFFKEVSQTRKRRIPEDYYFPLFFLHFDDERFEIFADSLRL